MVRKCVPGSVIRRLDLWGLHNKAFDRKATALSASNRDILVGNAGAAGLFKPEPESPTAKIDMDRGLPFEGGR